MDYSWPILLQPTGLTIWTSAEEIIPIIVSREVFFIIGWLMEA